MPPNNTTEIHFDLGQHSAKIEQLQADMTQMKADMHEVKRILSEARGGWKVLAFVSGFSGLFGAAIVKLLYMLGMIKG